MKMIVTTNLRYNGKTLRFQRVENEPNWENGMYVFPLVNGVYKNGPVYPLDRGDAGLAQMLSTGAEVIEEAA